MKKIAFVLNDTEATIMANAVSLLGELCKDPDGEPFSPLFVGLVNAVADYCEDEDGEQLTPDRLFGYETYDPMQEEAEDEEEEDYFDFLDAPDPEEEKPVEEPKPTPNPQTTNDDAFWDFIQTMIAMQHCNAPK